MIHKLVWIFETDIKIHNKILTFKSISAELFNILVKSCQVILPLNQNNLDMYSECLNTELVCYTGFSSIPRQFGFQTASESQTRKSQTQCSL